MSGAGSLPPAPGARPPRRTPPPKDRWSARGFMLFGLFCVVVLAGGLGGWGALAKLQGAVISNGHLRVESQRQVVQHPDGGVVGEILVHEGDLVKAGQVLIRLDGTAARSELAVLESQLYELMARSGRLTAEQTGADRILFDPELVQAAKDDPRVQSLIDGQQALFAARRTSLQREIEVGHQREAQISEQIAGSEAQVEALKRQRALIEEELTGQRLLLKKGLAQASRVLALEREAARLDGQTGQMVAQAAELKGKISQIEVERLKLENKRREDAISDLRDIGFRELEMKEKRIALRQKLSRLDIRAPLAGVVLDMKVFALKSVIRAAEPILYIVPTDSALVVDAQVSPVNIDSVRPGLDAVLRFPAFNRRTTPELMATVARVSPDAVVDQATKHAYYRAEVIMKPGEVEKLGGQKLVAGMPVEVFIQTGERTPLSYLVKPVSDYFNRAMREE